MKPALLTALLLLILSACEPPTIVDQAAPDAVVDLRAIDEAATATSITITWTAVGDDGREGGPAQQSIVYVAPEAIRSENLAQARPIEVPTPPKAPGDVETFVIDGLEPDSIVFFAVEIVDRVGQRALSLDATQQARGRTLDITAPGDIGDLRVEDLNSPVGGQLHLEWTLPDDEDVAGVIVRRGAGAAPTTPTAGVPVCEALLDAPATFCDDNGLANGVEQFYAVWATDDGGLTSASPATGSATPTDATQPLIPDLRADPLETVAGAVELSWLPEGDVADYEVVYSTSNFSATAFDEQTRFNAASSNLPDDRVGLVVTGLEEEAAYFFGVRGRDTSGNLGVAIVNAILPDVSPPPAATNVVAVDPGLADRFELSWTIDDPTGDIVSVQVNDSGGAARCNGDATLRSCTVTGSDVAIGASFSFVVVTLDGAGHQTTSSPSPSVTLGPQAVTDLVAADERTGGAIRLTWSATQNPGALGVSVARKTTPFSSEDDTSGVTVLTDGSDFLTEFVDATVTNGTEYFYAVRTHVNGVFSRARFANATPSDVTAPPLPLQFIATSNGVRNRVEFDWRFDPNVAYDFLDEVRIRRSSCPFDAGSSELVRTSSTGLSGGVDNGVVDGETYCYQLTMQDNATPPNVSAPLFAQVTHTITPIAFTSVNMARLDGGQVNPGGGVDVQSDGSVVITGNLGGGGIITWDPGGANEAQLFREKNGFIARFAPDGSFIGATQTDCPGDSTFRDVVVHDDGRLVVVGKSSGTCTLGGGTISDGGVNVVIASVAAQALAWEQSFTTELDTNEALDAVADASGNTFVSMSFRGSIDLGATFVNEGFQDQLVLALAADGTLSWARAIRLGANSGGHIDVDAAGNVFVTSRSDVAVELARPSGTTTTDEVLLPAQGSFGQSALISLDTLGEPRWAVGFGATPIEPQLIDVAATASGAWVAFFASSTATITDAAGNTSTTTNGTFLAHFDDDGVLTVVEPLSRDPINANSVAATDDGGLVVSGLVSGPATFGEGGGLEQVNASDPTLFFARLDGDARLQWIMQVKVLGGLGSPLASEAVAVRGRAIYVTGQAMSDIPIVISGGTSFTPSVPGAAPGIAPFVIRLDE